MSGYPTSYERIIRDLREELRVARARNAELVSELALANSFHRVAVLERNLAWLETDRLREQLEQFKAPVTARAA